MPYADKRIGIYCISTPNGSHRFSSQREAARAVRPENPTGASAQICKVCYGIKKSAYGYTWHAEVANGQ